jgi:hypothetical protein
VAGNESDVSTVGGYRIEYYSAGGSTFVFGDTDGVAGADFMIELSGTPALSSSSFIISASQFTATSADFSYASQHQDYYWA